MVVAAAVVVEIIEFTNYTTRLSRSLNYNIELSIFILSFLRYSNHLCVRREEAFECEKVTCTLLCAKKGESWWLKFRLELLRLTNLSNSLCSDVDAKIDRGR